MWEFTGASRVAESRSHFAHAICGIHERSVKSIFSIGDLLSAAKATLLHGEYTRMVREDLPFSPRMALNYRHVAEKTILRKKKHVSALPPSIGTLMHLARLEDKVLSEAFEKGTITPNLVREDVKNLMKVDDELLGLVPVTCDSNVKVLTGDMSLLQNWVEDESADLIFTDPPYGGRYLELYGRLSALARAKLKPGSLCLCYIGKYHLPEAVRLLTKDLEYHWMASFNFTRHRTVHPRRMHSCWRPILILKKPGDPPSSTQWSEDLAPQGKRDKTYHEWQQSVDTATYYIRRLTLPGQLVIDPFAGSGTTGVACASLGRHFVGTEIDEETARIARHRIFTTHVGTDEAASLSGG